MPFWAKWGLSLGVAVALIWVGWRYTPVLVTLHVLVCLVLVGVIMLQSGNAADLAGRFWRLRQPDGIWPARRSNVSFSRDHVVRDCVHDDVTDAFSEARAYGGIVKQRIIPGANAEGGKGSRDSARYRASGAGPRAERATGVVSRRSPAALSVSVAS